MKKGKESPQSGCLGACKVGKENLQGQGQKHFLGWVFLVAESLGVNFPCKVGSLVREGSLRLGEVLCLAVVRETFSGSPFLWGLPRAVGRAPVQFGGSVGPPGCLPLLRQVPGKARPGLPFLGCEVIRGLVTVLFLCSCGP